jgi:hypothetical protein
MRRNAAQRLRQLPATMLRQFMRRQLLWAASLSNSPMRAPLSPWLLLIG